jgi:Peptidase C10 family/Spi protease inhibitor/Secretion system C-terminal sorting domain
MGDIGQLVDRFYLHAIKIYLTFNNKTLTPMRKNYTLLMAVLLSALSAFSSTVDVDYAMKTAQNFYTQTTGKTVTFTLAYQCQNTDATNGIPVGTPMYYVFNAGGNNGFVIVSAENVVKPILAYGTAGQFTLQNGPPAVRDWLDVHYRKQIAYAKLNMTAPSTAVSTQWNNYYNNIITTNTRGTQAVSPLTQTIWNQSPYYNDMCPYDPTQGQNCVTGCVACAMAQIMRFWNYPPQGTGFHSYNDQNFGTLSANFGATTYNWANMPLSISADNTDVETLMSHAGIAVNMNYGVNESTAYVIMQQAIDNSGDSSSAEYAYKTYFGYDPTSVKGLLEADYAESDWINMMEAELNAGRPIEYQGSGTEGGHTWVCDGYDANNNFNMNWGWGGADAGYYSIDALDPSVLGTGGGSGNFNSNEGMVIGIKPVNGGGTTPINQANISLTDAVTPSANPVTYGSSFSVSTVITNNGSQNFTGNFGAAVFDNSGVFQGWLQLYTAQTLNASTSYNATFSVNSLTLIPGTYYVGIYYQNGNNNYSLLTGATNPIQIFETGAPNVIQMYSPDTIFPAYPQVAQSFTVDADIANTGGTDLTGYVGAFLFNLAGDTLLDTVQILSGTLTAMDYYNLHFASNGISNIKPGTYWIAFYESTDGGANWNFIYNSQADPNPVPITFVAPPIAPDQYEPDNTPDSAYVFPVNFTGNNCEIQTTGSNIHWGEDVDFYKINLPSGTDYAITAHVDDSYNSTNSIVYTNDVVLSYSQDGGNTWSDAYDPALPGQIGVANGGSVIFLVADYFEGSVGTYLLDINITQGVLAINETAQNTLKIYPNPASDYVTIDAGNTTGNYTLKLYNALGEVVSQSNGILSGQKLTTNVKGFAAGMYTIQLITDAGTVNSKLVVK